MVENPSTYFWWARAFHKYFFKPFWWIILSAVVLFVPFLRVWWWFFIPLFLAREVRILYLWWVRWDHNYFSTKWITLRIIPQKEALVPLKAMEDVFSTMWSPLYDTINWRERWFEGAYYPWMSWEVVSIEGNLHFYVYLKSVHRAVVESCLHSHFPEMEIYEVPDYAKNIPQGIPNQDWDIYGEEFALGNKDFYPIKTYEKFFEPQGERISAEEKRIDPLASLLEAMAKIGSGEQVWLQFVIGAVENPAYKKEAQNAIAKIAKREVKNPKTFWGGVGNVTSDVVLGPKKEGSGEKATYKWATQSQRTESGEREMLLTPGERQTVSEIEDKIKKPAFKATIRGMYVAKRESWDASNRLIPRTYFSHFQTSSNFLRYSLLTRPKTHYVFRKRIPFFRKRRLLRNYILRFYPFFPDLEKETSILNTEEMATLFHFPLKIMGVTFPTVERVEHKRGGPPSSLPVE